MPEEEQEEVLRTNMPLLVGRTLPDEIELRAALVKARAEAPLH
jgi:hypothetical protein